LLLLLLLLLLLCSQVCLLDEPLAGVQVEQVAKDLLLALGAGHKRPVWAHVL
jgi:hypothetical protein